jgi:hypothetical protein
MRGFAPGQGMHHELAGGAFENALQYVPGKLTLSLLSRQARLIDVRSLAFVSANYSLCGHDLKKFEYAGVACGPFLLQRVVDLPDRGRAAGPENPEDFKLRCGRFLRRSFHGKRPYYEGIRSVNENLRRLLEVKNNANGKLFRVRNRLGGAAVLEKAGFRLNWKGLPTYRYHPLRYQGTLRQEIRFAPLPVFHMWTLATISRPRR